MKGRRFASHTQSQCSSCRVSFTGHSLGGALAALAFADIGKGASLITFGAPRVGMLSILFESFYSQGTTQFTSTIKETRYVRRCDFFVFCTYIGRFGARISFPHFLLHFLVIPTSRRVSSAQAPLPLVLPVLEVLFMKLPSPRSLTPRLWWITGDSVHC